MKTNQALFLSVLLATVPSCKQDQPVHIIEVDRSQKSQPEAAQADAAQAPVNDQVMQEPVPPPVDETAADKEAGKVAPPQKVSQVDSNLVQTICSNPPAMAKVQAQLAVLCIGGKPTDAFATAYLAPFKGVGAPPVQMLKAAVFNGVSDFIFLSVSETTKPVADVFAQHVAMSSSTIKIANATADQTVVANRPGKAPEDLGSLDIRTTTTVGSGFFSSTSSRFQTSEATALAADKSSILINKALKFGAPQNGNDFIVSTMTLLVKDGAATKIIRVSLKKLNNQGFPTTTQQVSKDLEAAQLVDDFSKIAP